MHKEILNSDQNELLEILPHFRPDFYLAGGTAIALHIGHRRSIDFDLFSPDEINAFDIIKVIRKTNYKITQTLENTADELTFLINHTKFTFLHYPFQILDFINFEDYIQIPQLKILAAMKAYTIGRRPKWKDYVDLYYLLKDHFTIKEITQQAKKIHDDLFNERIFREQLCYYEDIDFTESINYISDPIDKNEIKKFLIDVATDK
jgi:hypothetical protein